MGNRRRDVQILLGKCSCDLPVMQAEYESSLAEKSIPDSLRIKLKSFFENLRSVLDYLAHDISDTHCGGKTKSSRLYFPIVQDRPSFAGQMSRWFPGLEKKAPDLWKYLMTVA